MKRIKIKSSAGKKTLFLPEWWGEVTTAQYERLVKEWDASDLVKLFSILSGIEYKTLSETHDAKLEEALIESVRFVYDTKPAFKEAKVPPFVTIEGKKIAIPKKLGSLSIGQNIMVRQQMDKAKTFDEMISLVTAIYLQPFYDTTDEEIMKAFGSGFHKTVVQRTGEFNYEKALALHEKVLELPITDTYPIGIFFLKRLQKSGINLKRIWINLITLSRKIFMIKGKALQK